MDLKKTGYEIANKFSIDLFLIEINKSVSETFNSPVNASTAVGVTKCYSEINSTCS